MKTLASLEKRLQALPGIREGKRHEALYSEYLRKSNLSKEKIGKTTNAIAYAAPVLPAKGFSDARKTVNATAVLSSRLAKNLVDQAGAVAAPNTDASFIRLFENAENSVKECETAWESQLQGKIQEWEIIADVTSRLAEEGAGAALKAQARRLKAAIDSLRGAKNKLPQNKQNASAIQTNLQQLNDAVTKLGLDTAFGKFLKAAASPQGADLKQAQADEVSKQIEELKLSKVFRVRLTS